MIRPESAPAAPKTPTEDGDPLKRQAALAAKEIAKAEAGIESEDRKIVAARAAKAAYRERIADAKRYLPRKKRAKKAKAE